MRPHILWPDVLKGCLMIFVVMEHAIFSIMPESYLDNHLWNATHSFIMPTFIALSGYLNYKGDNHLSQRWHTIGRRFLQLIVPFLIWSFVRTLVLGYYTKTFGFLRPILLPNSSYWFLWALFFITCVFYGADWLAEKTHICLEIISAFIAICFAVLMVGFEFRWFGFQHITYYFIFYALGYFLHQYKFNISQTWLLTLLTAIWAVLAWWWKVRGVPTPLQGIALPGTLLSYPYRFVTAIVAIAVIFSLLPRVKKENVITRFLSNIGAQSMGIYIFHMIIMPFIVKALLPIIPNVFWLITLTFVISFALAWILTWAIDNWSWGRRWLLGKHN